MKKVWTDEVVEFKGKYYHIPASKIGTKPVQKPHAQYCLVDLVKRQFHE